MGDHPRLGIVFAVLMTAAVLSLSSADSSAALVFDTLAFPTGDAPRFVAVGDLNGDGVLDLVTPNAEGNSASALLGKGDGTFGPHSDFATGRRPFGIALSDFDGDGMLDIATANLGDLSTPSNSTVSVLLGKGDGTFKAKSNYGTGKDARDVAAGDLNGDGSQDLVVPNSADNNVAILIGTGHGGFKSRVLFDTGPNPFAVSIGDVNGDYAADVAVANLSGSSVSILLGDGKGAFPSRTDLGAGPAPRDVALADLDADGRLDLVVLNQSANTVSIRLGNGDGTFSSRRVFGTSTSPVSVAVGDLDGDGRLDLAVAALDNIVSVLLGNGDGTFGAATNYVAGSAGVAIADLDRDGRSDIAAGRQNTDEVFVLLNRSVASTATARAFQGASQAIARNSSLSVSISPNPLNPEAMLTFETRTSGFARVRVFDSQGRMVRSLLEDPALNAGVHRIRIRGEATGGARLASGVYFYRIETAEAKTAGQFTILK